MSAVVWQQDQGSDFLSVLHTAEAPRVLATHSKKNGLEMSREGNGAGEGTEAQV